MALADSAGMRDLAELKSRVRAFVAERDWERFHSPKNLAMALSVEASELVELFQWLTEEESATLDAAQRGRVAQELADVLWFLVRLSDRLDIDLLEAAELKLAENARKYPADRVRGQSKKYTDY
jgi:dCTP diphosphatase